MNTINVINVSVKKFLINSVFRDLISCFFVLIIFVHYFCVNTWSCLNHV